MNEESKGYERRQKIKELLNNEKTIYVKQTAELFQVSDMTIRRDLKVLEKEGIAAVFHGGASLRMKQEQEHTFTSRNVLMEEEKIMIARKACESLRQNSVIFLDTSTTVLQMIRFLPQLKLTVVTPSIAIASVLSRYQDITLYLCPGRYSVLNDGPMDYSTVEYTDRFVFDQVFLGAGSVDADSGISSTLEIEAAMKQRIITHAKEIYFLFDHTKFSKTYLFRICSLSERITIITDNALPQNERERIGSTGARLMLADGSKKNI